MIETPVHRSGSLAALRAENDAALAEAPANSPEETLGRLAGVLLDVAEEESADMDPGAVVTISIQRAPVPYPGGPLAIYGNVYVHPAANH